MGLPDILLDLIPHITNIKKYFYLTTSILHAVGWASGFFTWRCPTTTACTVCFTIPENCFIDVYFNVCG